MKLPLHLLSSALPIMILASCASGPNARTGTVLGALGGAAVGGIIGHQSGRDWKVQPSEQAWVPSAGMSWVVPAMIANTRDARSRGPTPMMMATAPTNL